MKPNLKSPFEIVINNPLAPLMLVILAALVRLPLLGRNLYEEHSFRQTQTAWVSREYFRNGIDLLNYPVQVFGPEANIPFEMPIFQAIVALLTVNVDHIEVTGRAISFVFFLLSGYLSYRLVRLWVSRNAGLLVLGIFLFSPFSLQWSSAFLIESLATTLGLFLVIAFDSWIRSGKKTWLVFGILTTIVAFLVKSTTGGTFLLFASVSLLITYQSKLVENSKLLMRTLFFALFAVLPALVATYFWVEYSDAIKSETSAGQTLTSTALRTWIYGTLQQKIDYGTWEVVSDRVVSGIWGPLGLISVTIAIFFLVWKQPRSRETALIIGSAIATLASIWIFLNLYYVHSYYLLAVYPMLAMILGGSVIMVSRGLNLNIFTIKILTPIAILSQLAFHISEPTSAELFRGFKGDKDIPLLSSVISANTEPSDLVIMVKCDWDPTFLYFADRKGYMVRNTFEPASAQSNLVLSEETDDYTLLVFCIPVESASDYVPETFWLTPIPSEVGQVFRISKNHGD
jgi:hypothetical protein